MKKSFLLIIMLMAWMSMVKAADTQLTLQVIPGRIHIDSSGSINIGTISSSPSPTEINQTFSSNSFRVGDLRWWPGYYTTIQFGDLIKWGDKITNTNIQLKTIVAPNIINGNTNSFMRFGSWIENQFGIVDQPTTYFVRKPNERTWSIGKFGDMPDIKITVPANQTWGTYRGTAYYTLYDME